MSFQVSFMLIIYHRLVRMWKLIRPEGFTVCTDIFISVRFSKFLLNLVNSNLLLSLQSCRINELHVRFGVSIKSTKMILFITTETVPQQRICKCISLGECQFIFSKGPVSEYLSGHYIRFVVLMCMNSWKSCLLVKSTFYPCYLTICSSTHGRSYRL